MTYSTSRQSWTLVSVLAVLMLIAGEALGQVYRCTTPDGQTEFSDRPCATDSEIHHLPSMRSPSAPAEERGQQRPPSQAESRAAEERERARQESLESQRRVQQAADRVRQIQEDNYDPARCAAVRSRIENYQRRDPLGASFSVDVIEWKQQERLYCGPS